MPTTTMSSREFNQDTSRAKKAAQAGPVIITDRGEPAHVLLTIADYERLMRDRMTVAQALAQTAAVSADADFAFDPPRIGGLQRPVDLE